MSGTAARVGLLAAALFGVSMSLSGAESDPFTFLLPDIVVGDTERARLAIDQPVVRVQSGREGFLALSAIVRTDVTAKRLVAWAREVEALQKGRYVPEIGRFSVPPRLEDLRSLTLDDKMLEDLQRCRPGNCVVKLADAEIAEVRAASSRVALESTFRRMLVQRAMNYIALGDACAPPYHDHKIPLRPEDAFTALLQRLEFFPRNMTRYADYLRRYPAPDAGVVQESFLYWSKETLGMKPIIGITHFSVARFSPSESPEVAIVAKQVYATHYKNASMTVTALAGDGSSRYLVYVSRSHVDAFQGVFGGVVRRIVERRVKAEAPGILLGLRRRFESGDPVSLSPGPPNP